MSTKQALVTSIKRCCSSNRCNIHTMLIEAVMRYQGASWSKHIYIVGQPGDDIHALYCPNP